MTESDCQTGEKGESTIEGQLANNCKEALRGCCIMLTRPHTTQLGEDCCTVDTLSRKAQLA